MLLKKINKSFIKKIISLSLVLYLIISSFIVSQAEGYEWSVINNIEAVETNSNINEENNLDNIKEDELSLECESAILIEQNSGQVLYEKNAHEQLRPASVTKLMSLLLIFEALQNRTNNSSRQSPMQSKCIINGRFTNMARYT